MLGLRISYICKYMNQSIQLKNNLSSSLKMNKKSTIFVDIPQTNTFIGIDCLFRFFIWINNEALFLLTLWKIITFELGLQPSTSSIDNLIYYILVFEYTNMFDSSQNSLPSLICLQSRSSSVSNIGRQKKNKVKNRTAK